MQTKTKIMLAGGLAGVLAIGSAAGLALADRGGHRGMGHGMMMTNMMERYDANKDGKISQDEIDQNRTARHGEFDADKNATLSLQEFRALWLKARYEDMVREFQEFDRDGNAQVTLDEYKAPVAQMVMRMDRDGDGMVGDTDHRRGHGKRMMKQDDDGPGKKDDGAQ